MQKKRKRIYLDYAAATPVCKEAREAMEKAVEDFGNPGAPHTHGLDSARTLNDARANIAKYMSVKASEIIFVSGGTEGNNLAILGYFNALEQRGISIKKCHAITSAIEHPSVLNVFAALKERGLAVSEVAPDAHGTIRPEAVKDALRKNTVFVSIGLVNSEIGTIQPVHAIAKAIRAFSTPTTNSSRSTKRTIVLHTDACQGMYVPLSPHGLGVDLLTLDSGKMYGPRGAGALYVKYKTPLAPIIYGGGQESGLRPGTENTMLCAGFAAALGEATQTRSDESTRLAELRKHLLEGIQKEISDHVLNGNAKDQSPHIANVSIAGIDVDYVVAFMGHRGIAISTKSACLERKDASESHVVAALGGEKWRKENTLRFSIGVETSKRDITAAVKLLKEAVRKYRSFNS
jgi:cysteine desulfurase